MSSTLDPRPGGLLRIDINGRDVIRGEYLEVDPPNRIVVTWGWEGEMSPLPPGASRVEITLTPDRAGTVVDLRLAGLDVGDLVDLHTSGWDHYLPRLAVVASRADPGPDPRAQTGVA